MFLQDRDTDIFSFTNVNSFKVVFSFKLQKELTAWTKIPIAEMLTHKYILRDKPRYLYYTLGYCNCRSEM